jgi:hypothetical protein
MKRIIVFFGALLSATLALSPGLAQTTLAGSADQKVIGLVQHA